MDDTHKQTRDDIRATIRQQRAGLDDHALQSAGNALLANCQRFLDKANTVAGYQAMLGEIPLVGVFAHCHKSNITTLLPIMHGEALLFAPFDATTTYSTKQYGIQEPDVPEAQWLQPDQLDLVLVPLVAFDITCNRIGMGGGFYDRSFEFRKNTAAPPTLVGVAHSLQQVDNVFAQSWDVGLDFIVTDTGVFQP